MLKPTCLFNTIQHGKMATTSNCFWAIFGAMGVTCTDRAFLIFTGILSIYSKNMHDLGICGL